MILNDTVESYALSHEWDTKFRKRYSFVLSELANSCVRLLSNSQQAASVLSSYKLPMSTQRKSTPANTLIPVKMIYNFFFNYNYTWRFDSTLGILSYRI